MRDILVPDSPFQTTEKQRTLVTYRPEIGLRAWQHWMKLRGVGAGPTSSCQRSKEKQQDGFQAKAHAASCRCDLVQCAAADLQAACCCCVMSIHDHASCSSTCTRWHCRMTVAMLMAMAGRQQPRRTARRQMKMAAMLAPPHRGMTAVAQAWILAPTMTLRFRMMPQTPARYSSRR